MRDGASSQQMSNAEVEDLFYAAGRLHFDRKPCPDFSLENDLDDETWTRFSGRAKIPESMDRIVALRNLGLLDGEDRMTHAGAWLLARDIRRFTTAAHVSCALFMGTEKVRILDRRDFHSDIPAMVDDAVAWILTKINIELGAALLRWRPNQSLRRRRGRRQLDPSRPGEERRRVRWPTVLLSSATDGGLPLVLARFVRGLSTHQGSGCPRRLRTAATAAKCHRAPVDSHRVADQMPTGPSMSWRRAPHAASPLPRG